MEPLNRGLLFALLLVAYNGITLCAAEESEYSFPIFATVIFANENDVIQ